MDPKIFQDSSAGIPVQHPNGYWYFLPADLPPALNWSSSLVSILAEAERNLGRLAGSGRYPAGLNWLVPPFIRREAVLSTRIEGTRASISDLYTYEARQLSYLESNSDAIEVFNYVQALEYGMDRLQTLPVSLRLIRELHSKLLANIPGNHLTPGYFRRSQNWIGPPGCTLSNAPFVPPPFEDMLNALNQLEIFIHTPDELPALIRVALIHYQFEAIHPFLDGNGRIGRLLIILLLQASNLLPQPHLFLSAYFEANRKEYYDHLLAVSQQGEWEAWLQFFLTGISVQSENAIQRITQMQALYDTYVELLQTQRASARLIETLDLLFERPILTIRQVEAGLGVPFRTASRYIEKLVQLGVLVEVTGRARNRIYRANEILSAIEV